MIKNTLANAGDPEDRLDLWAGRIPWGRKWQSTPVFLPGEAYGQKSLAGYSPWGHNRVGHDLVTIQQQQQSYKITSLTKLHTLWSLRSY